MLEKMRIELIDELTKQLAEYAGISVLISFKIYDLKIYDLVVPYSTKIINELKHELFKHQ